MNRLSVFIFFSFWNFEERDSFNALTRKRIASLMSRRDALVSWFSSFTAAVRIFDGKNQRSFTRVWCVFVFRADLRICFACRSTSNWICLCDSQMFDEVLCRHANFAWLDKFDRQHGWKVQSAFAWLLCRLFHDFLKLFFLLFLLLDFGLQSEDLVRVLSDALCKVMDNLAALLALGSINLIRWIEALATIDGGRVTAVLLVAGRHHFHSDGWRCVTGALSY